MRFTTIRLAAILALSLFSPLARADTVRLTNDRTVEDVHVRSDAAGGVVLVKRGIELTVAKSDVISIDAAPTSEDRVAEAVRAAGDDPARLDAAATLARVSGLTARASEIETMARDARVAAILSGVDRRDAVALVMAAERVTAAGLGSDATADVYRLAVAADPDCASAHQALGEVRFDGAWLPAAEAAQRAEARFEAEQHAKGLVLRDGAWITQAEARAQDAAAAREAAQERAEQAREAAEQEAERIACERAERQAARQRAIEAARERACAPVCPPACPPAQDAPFCGLVLDGATTGFTR